MTEQLAEKITERAFEQENQNILVEKIITNKMCFNLDKDRNTQLQIYITLNQKSAIPSHLEICLKYASNFDYLLNWQNSNEDTALHIAVRYGEFSIVSNLTSSAIIKLELTNKDGFTPLGLAVRMNKTEAVTILENKGASFANPKNFILHNLVAYGNYNRTEELLQSGKLTYAINDRDNNALLPIDYAWLAKNDGLSNLLIKYGSSKSSFEHFGFLENFSYNFVTTNICENTPYSNSGFLNIEKFLTSLVSGYCLKKNGLPGIGIGIVIAFLNDSIIKYFIDKLITGQICVDYRKYTSNEFPQVINHLLYNQELYLKLGECHNGDIQVRGFTKQFANWNICHLSGNTSIIAEDPHNEL